LEPTVPDPSAVELNFDTVKEGWSIYTIKDTVDVALKVKLILLKFFLEGLDSEGNARFGAGANIILTTSVPKELKGAKDTQSYPIQEIANSVVAEDIPFDTVKEEWNEYKSSEGVILGVKLVVTMVSRTSKYDMNGDPVYYVKHQAVQKAKIPPEARDKLKNILDSRTQ